MFRLALYPIGDSYLLVAVLAAALAGLLAIGPPKSRTPAVRRRRLAAIRLLIVALVIVAMLRPTLIYTESKKQSATLVMLLDDSRSMSVPDAIGGKTRYEMLKQAVADAGDALGRLAADYEVKVYRFDAEARPVGLDGGTVPLPDAPEGRQSAIGAALEDVLRQEAGKRLLGVLLLSDGAQRAVAPRDVAPQIAAMRLKQLGTRLFTFPFGQARGLGQARDIAVKELSANEQVFVKNDLEVVGQVRVDGYLNRPVPVQLLFETAPGKMEVVAEKRVQATAEGQLVDVRFRYSPTIAGDWKLSLAVAGQPGELVTTNNVLSTFVRVMKGGLKVLYIEGEPRVEQKFLRRSLDASPDIQVDYRRLDARRPETRPAGLGDWFRPGAYDVYILGDLDADAATNAQWAELAEAVSRGAGLIMLGGFHSFGAGGYARTPLARVLPIDMDRLERQNFDEPIRRDLHLPGPLRMTPTEQGLRHYVMMLGNTAAESEATWTKLPPLEGANRFQRLAPAATVLAESQKAPLLVAHSFGVGRVMALAVDSTWRWWMRGHETAHKRFWRQIVLWLARKDQAGESALAIAIDQRRVAPATRVEFGVSGRSPAGELIEDLAAEAVVIAPDGARRAVPLVRQEAQLRGSVRDTLVPGDYVVEVTGKQKDQGLGTARGRFLVYEQDLELDNASADVAVMQSLAAVTGGESLAPEQLPELVDRLAGETASLEVPQETKKTFWDTWPFFLAIVGLLGLEWVLRKRWGLV